MKRKYWIWVVLLLAAAGVIGWFLPVLIIENQDAMVEGKPEPVSIRQIDISYQTDLSAADKLRLMRERPSADTVPLERGIFMTDRDVRSVVEQFLKELTGNPLELGAKNFSAAPMLLNYGSEGSVLVWNVMVSLDDSWRCDAVVDDQTGLLLECSFSGYPEWWETLFYDLESVTDVREHICSVLGDALCAHCSRQLAIAYTASLTEKDMQDFGGSGVFLLSENGQERLRFPFLLILREGLLTINQ